jgi:hypothetical protein
MGRALGFVSLLIAMGIGFYLYTKSAQSTSPGGEGSPKITIDINGVKQDLLSIAKAEQGRMASDGKYLSLDELIAGKDLTMSSNNRDGYTYSVEVNGTSFRAVATYGGNIQGYPKTVWTDSSMQMHIE